MLIENLRNRPETHPHVRMLTGKTPIFASTLDQRFSFHLYIPKAHKFSGPNIPLLVIIHGTLRQTGGYLNALKPFSESHNCAILCPIFPAGIDDPGDLHNYKNILYRGIRFDLVLLSMLDQASNTWRLRTDKFFLHGFSGGGQFAHRFFYLHPSRLLGASIGAPGRTTPPDTEKDWPAGVRDAATLFGVEDAPNFGEMAKVPVQFVVGDRDVDTALLDLVTSPNAGEVGTRVERIRWLRDRLAARGVRSELSIVKGVGHAGVKCLPVVEEWIKQLL